MRPRFQSIIFDFDYTLADSSRGVAQCINFALAELGLAQVPLRAAQRTIGLHLDEAFVQLAGERDVAEKEAFRRHFARRADLVMNELTLLFDPVRPTVARLKARGITLAIVSTKNRSRIESFLERENLSQAFDFIIGGEDVSRHKPDPEGLQQAVARLNTPLEESLYVGDSVVDAEAARRAGMAFAAVLSGVTAREEFDGYPVAAVVENLVLLDHWL